METHRKLYSVLCILALLLTLSLVLFNLFHTPKFSSNAVLVGEDKLDLTSTEGDSSQQVNDDTVSEKSTDENESDLDEIYYNLNTATMEQLESVPGIGEVKASAIIELREELGGFTSVDQLLDVSGIGEVIFEQIEPYFYVE